MHKHHYPDSTQAKKDIIGSLRNSSTGRYVQLPEPPAGSFVTSSAESPIDLFRSNLLKAGGLFDVLPDINKLVEVLKNTILEHKWNEVYCPYADLINLLNHSKPHVDISNLFSLSVEVAITKCESLVAETGTILVSSALSQTRQVYSYAPIHIVVASTSQLKGTLDEAISEISEKYGTEYPSTITAITGPSRTADIEKTLILGAHGPKTLEVFVSESEF